MSIRLQPAALINLSTVQTVLYQAPADCISSTLASGTIENQNVSRLPARFYMKITGRNVWIMAGKVIEFDCSPFVIPPVSLLPGESLVVWADVANIFDIAVTMGEQR